MPHARRPGSGSGRPTAPSRGRRRRAACRCRRPAGRRCRRRRTPGRPKAGQLGDDPLQLVHRGGVGQLGQPGLVLDRRQQAPLGGAVEQDARSGSGPRRSPSRRGRARTVGHGHRRQIGHGHRGRRTRATVVAHPAIVLTRSVVAQLPGGMYPDDRARPHRAASAPGRLGTVAHARRRDPRIRPGRRGRPGPGGRGRRLRRHLVGRGQPRPLPPPGPGGRAHRAPAGRHRDRRGLRPQPDDPGGHGQRPPGHDRRPVPARARLARSSPTSRSATP